MSYNQLDHMLLDAQDECGRLRAILDAIKAEIRARRADADVRFDHATEAEAACFQDGRHFEATQILAIIEKHEKEAAYEG